MSSFINVETRKMVPRWRFFSQSERLGELQSTTPPHSDIRVDATGLDELREAWEEHRTLYHATDLVSNAVALGRGEIARDAAEYVLDSGSRAPHAALAMAQCLLTGERPADGAASSDRASIAKYVRRLREWLREHAQDSVMWVDLALAHTVLGNNVSAGRAIRTALGLSPNNRFVLRAASRFFIHNKDYATAHTILLRAEKTKEDPWLLAAEIVTAAILGRPSRLIKSARVVVSDDSINPLHRSELAGSLATLELDAGKDRRAKKLFRRALIQPTENALAQVEFASRKLSGLSANDRALQATPNAFEAQAWQSFNGGDWNQALDSSIAWFGDQPFSSRPAQFGSFMAATLLEQHEQAIEILKLAQRANPDDLTLLNNLAFSYASLGRVGDAAKVLERVRVNAPEIGIRVALLATTGLVHFRQHNPKEGRRYYREAIELAKREGRLNLAFTAELYLAREEVLAGTDLADEALARARRTSKRFRHDLLLDAISKNVEKKVAEVSSHPVPSR